jgi:hypothetical protein
LIVAVISGDGAVDARIAAMLGLLGCRPGRTKTLTHPILGVENYLISGIGLRRIGVRPVFSFEGLGDATVGPFTVSG